MSAPKDSEKPGNLDKTKGEYKAADEAEKARGGQKPDNPGFPDQPSASTDAGATGPGGGTPAKPGVRTEERGGSTGMNPAAAMDSGKGRGGAKFANRPGKKLVDENEDEGEAKARETLETIVAGCPVFTTEPKPGGPAAVALGAKSGQLIQQCAEGLRAAGFSWGEILGLVTTIVDLAQTVGPQVETIIQQIRDAFGK